MIRSRRPSAPPRSVAPDDSDTGPRDEGSVLMLALVFILVGSLMVVPLLSYANSVLRANKVQVDKVSRAEATRGNLRTVLAEPKALYDACSKSGLTVPVNLASAKLAIGTSVQCTTIKDDFEMNSATLRRALATIQAGAVQPIGSQGTYYTSPVGDTTSWMAGSSDKSTAGVIWTPPLPIHGLNHPSSVGYMMPDYGLGTCRVFFPGTYEDPVTISDNVPTYFASGVYYFENTVTFSGAANVVIGSGAEAGCTEDQEAAFNAINAPFTVNISGIGATFVLGAAGRMVVTDGGGAVGPSVKFNSRLVFQTDLGNLVSQGVSIISVNGITTGATTSADLDLPGQLHVPKSLTEADPTDAVPPVDAASKSYRPSTLVPTVLPAAPQLPIIDISYTGGGKSTVFVPGYIAVPQGTVNISLGAGSQAQKIVHLVGGLLAAQVTQSAVNPPDLTAMATPVLPAEPQLEIGLVNRVVQKTFKIVSQTSPTLHPHLVSVAIVQINDYGEIAINSWVTSTA
jgi:hypothetical protein